MTNWLKPKSSKKRHKRNLVLHLRRLGQKDRHSPFNLREVTREQYAMLAPYRNLGD
ncbi:hypothetical protein [Veillonella sp. oral taxon 158]|uniref:hypothetical protein n=1 Tax=Veillonella sp. oral taxon 158 TaxID=671228 RepID=UPI002357D4D4|nr:hypothetical protein [Veillonella sp. oral taxon 158]